MGEQVAPLQQKVFNAADRWKPNRKPDDSSTFIITGGAGFIGSAIAWMLNSHGIENILLVDHLGNDPYKWKNLRGITFSDILSPSDFLNRIQQTAFPEASTVIHMGACSATTERDAEYLVETNYRYSKRIGTWAIENGKRFLYASSAAIYGDGSRGFSDAPNLLPHFRPLNMYGYSKQLFDLHVLRHGWDAQCVGLRFFNIFGPNEYHKGAMRSMIFKSVQQIRGNGEVCLFKSTDPRYADGQQVRDFLYVKDAVDLIWLILQRPDINGIFNIGSGEPHTWNDLAKAVFSALDINPLIRYIDMPADIKGQYQSFTCADLNALNSALGSPWPSFAFRDAVRDYVTGYLSTGDFENLDFNHQNMETK